MMLSGVTERRSASVTLYKIVNGTLDNAGRNCFQLGHIVCELSPVEVVAEESLVGQLQMEIYLSSTELCLTIAKALEKSSAYIH